MNAVSALENPGASVDAVSLRRWVALLGAMLGAFMAVLDIQITNASLNDIVGTLGATLDEGSWISTSYLVGEIVVIPLTAWMALVFSPRRYLLVNTTLFLVFSIACAQAWNLPGMIIFRALQGLSGGVLIPMAFTLVLKLLPPSRRALGFGIFGITATFAPSIGPTVGGWLTDNYGWPTIFYLNLLPGMLMLAAIGWGLDREPMQLHRLRKGDWWGIGTMALGLGTLIVFLEEGNRHDWFASRAITTFAVVAAVSLLLCVVIELRQTEPFINLRLLARRNFGLGSLISVATGVGLYGAMYLLPLYLAQVQGYNAQQIGETMMWSGLPQLVMMPLAALLSQRLDNRLLIAVGLGFFSASCFVNSTMTNLSGYDQLCFTQLLRAVGMPFLMVPLTAISTADIEAEFSGSASALFNMLRNLGGSIGIALLATQLDLREKLHSFRIGESVSIFSAETQQRLAGLTAHFLSAGGDSQMAGRQALGALANTVRREAFVMAYGDCFFIVGVVLLAMIPVVWLCRPARGGFAAAH